MSPTVTKDTKATPITAVAKARYVRITPMKARRVIDLVRGKNAEEALDILRFAPQAASTTVAKVVASAVANAKNNYNADARTLVISKAYADEGPTLKRIRPHAHGRAFRILKRTSHITIEVQATGSAQPRNRNRRKGA